MKLGELKGHIRSLLMGAGVEPLESNRESEMIVEHVSNYNTAEQILKADSPVDRRLIMKAEQIVDRRVQREPLQYILGSAWFMGLKFEVASGVFIPRPDTETLVEVTFNLLKAAKGDKKLKIAEIGVGSGCVSISLLRLFERVEITAVDISAQALEMTRKNAITYGVQNRLKLIQGDWKTCLPRDFDGITSNPPYIPLKDEPTLAPEVRMYEPGVALFGSGEDGLGFYRDMSKILPRHLKKTNRDHTPFLTLEVGFGQADAVVDMLSSHKWQRVVAHKDISGIHRTIAASPPQ